MTTYIEKIAYYYPDREVHALGPLYTDIVWDVGASVTQATLDALTDAEEEDVVGSIISTVYSGSGTNFVNKWFSKSDVAPYVITYDSDVISMTFSNEKADANIWLEFYRIAANASLDTRVLAYTWILPSCRIAHNHAVSGLCGFNKGDKIAIFGKANPSGNNPAGDPMVTVYFKVRKGDLYNHDETFSGNIISL